MEQSEEKIDSKNEVRSVKDTNEHGIDYNSYKGFWSLQVCKMKLICLYTMLLCTNITLVHMIYYANLGIFIWHLRSKRVNDT